MSSSRSTDKMQTSMDKLSKALINHMAKETRQLTVVKKRQAAFEKRMDENAATLTQVRDILSSFRVVGACAKWAAAVGTGLVAVYHGYDVVKEWVRR